MRRFLVHSGELWQTVEHEVSGEDLAPAMNELVKKALVQADREVALGRIIVVVEVLGEEYFASTEQVMQALGVIEDISDGA